MRLLSVGETGGLFRMNCILITIAKIVQMILYFYFKKNKKNKNTPLIDQMPLKEMHEITPICLLHRGRNKESI